MDRTEKPHKLGDMGFVPVVRNYITGDKSYLLVKVNVDDSKPEPLNPNILAVESIKDKTRKLIVDVGDFIPSRQVIPLIFVDKNLEPYVHIPVFDFLSQSENDALHEEIFRSVEGDIMAISNFIKDAPDEDKIKEWNRILKEGWPDNYADKVTTQVMPDITTQNLNSTLMPTAREITNDHHN